MTQIVPNKYSIVLPVRNGGEHVKECIKSLLNQTISTYDIIVLDNNSNDGTFEWIKSLNSEKITIHHSTINLTIEENWARILSVPKNEFITIIGHDDILFPNYLETINDLIEQFPTASLYLTHFDYIDENGTRIRDCRPMAESLHASDFLQMQMSDQYDSTGSGYLMRSKDFDYVGGMPTEYPNLIFADFQLWISVMLPTTLSVSTKKCFSFRIHESTSKKTNGMAFQEAFSLYITYITNLSNRYPEIKKVVTIYGKKFLLYYCEALSHRLLKTPYSQRSISVSGFIKKCKDLAVTFIPGQEFKPERKIKILLAELIDKTTISRKIFQFIKKIG